MGERTGGGDLRRKKTDGFQLQISDEQLEDFPENGDGLQSYSEPPKPTGIPDQKIQKNQQKQAAKAHRKRNKEKRKKNRRIFRFVWFFMILIVSIALAQYLISGVNDMLAVGKPSLHVTVEIPADATNEQVANILKENNIIRDTDFFRLYSKVTKADGNYRSGQFELSTDMDYEALINTLQSNISRVSTKVTIPEGANILDLASKLVEEGVLTNETKEEFLQLCNSNTFDEAYPFLEDISNTADRYYKLEGYLFPDTYLFYLSQEPDEVIEKFLDNTKNKLDEETLQKAADKNLTMDQLLTLASMIQKEAANAQKFPDDMKNISSIFQNRLNSDVDQGFLYLNSDPTMYYPYATQTAADEAEGPGFTGKYNTYQVQGLPPGAICNPGMAAIQAVLEPKETQYYYFCHNTETQEPYYARTEQQHEQNKRKAGLTP